MQKTGGGLYLHNWLHNQNDHSVNTDLPAIGQNGLSCTCLDDFNIPFSESPEIVIQIPVVVQIEFTVASIPSILISPKFFPSLRGPPQTA
jgi:hypothetical protein